MALVVFHSHTQHCQQECWHLRGVVTRSFDHNAARPVSLHNHPSLFIPVLLSTQHNNTIIQLKMCPGTSPHQIPDSHIQEQHSSSNEDVLMDDSVLDPSLSTIILDDMDTSNIQHSPLGPTFRTCSLGDDPFFTSESSAGSNPSVDRNGFGCPLPCDNMSIDSTGDEFMHNPSDGFCAQFPGYPNDNYASQTSPSNTNITNSHLPAQSPPSYPLGPSSYDPQHMPSIPEAHYPTPASIQPRAEPEVVSPKTPTKSTKKARKSKRGSQNKQKKDWICPYCNRASTCASNLDEHILTHSKVKDYLCTFVNEKGDICHKRFARPWGLTRHCNDVHKIEIEIKKGGRGMRILGPLLGKRSPKKPEADHKQKLRPSGSPSSPSYPRTAYTPNPIADHIRITTPGPDGLCLCATCSSAFAEGNDLLVHNHLDHELPVSSFCLCDYCSSWRFTFQTPTGPCFTFSNVYGSIDDKMEVEAPEVDMKIDPRLLPPAADDFDMMKICPSPIVQDSAYPTSTNVDFPSPSSSPTASVSSMDQESPILTPPPTHPVDNPISAACARLAENTTVSYSQGGHPIHHCPSVSPTTFYGFMGLDYYNMTNEQRRAYLGGAWN